MFTDNPTVLEWSGQYSYIVICLSFGSLFHIEIEKMFQATGNMFLPMIMQGVGAIVNIILDPIMIFGLLDSRDREYGEQRQRRFLDSFPRACYPSSCFVDTVEGFRFI